MSSKIEQSQTNRTTVAGLNRDRILDAALQLADERGLDCLSMRTLAGILSVQAMSLYNHVANKDDIIDALVDRVVAGFDLPQAGGDWQVQMKRRSHSMYQVLSKHAWATLSIVSRITVGPARLQFLEATLACLAAAGFTLPEADHVMNAFDSFTYGFVLQELKMPIKKQDFSSAAEHYLPTIDQERYPNFAALARLIIRREYDGINRLELGLDWLLAGLGRLGI